MGAGTERHRPIWAKCKGPGLGRGRVLNNALYRGTPPRGPAGRPGSDLALVRLRRSYSALLPSPIQANLRTSVMRFWRHHGIFPSDVGSKWRPSPSWNRRLPPTTPTQAREHAGRNMLSLIVQMSSGRLFLDGVLASIARLCFTGTARVTLVFWMQPETGHFYFAPIGRGHARDVHVSHR